MLDLLIPLKLAFLHSLGRMGVCLTYDSRESFMRMIELLVFPAVGLAVILFSAVAFIFGLSGVAYGIHNVFEFLLITAMLGLACYYGLLRTHRLADALRRRAAHRFFLLQAVTFGCAIVGLALHGTIPQPGGALLGAATMFFYNAVLVLWAHRYLPPLESALETADGSGTVHLLKQFGITKREGEVIRLICEGKSNKEIADRLFISMDTVKDHNHNIFRKTGVTNRVQLVNLFRRVRRIEL
jgi:DNA-binding CsgD family transcriptional regulator